MINGGHACDFNATRKIDSHIGTCLPRLRSTSPLERAHFFRSMDTQDHDNANGTGRGVLGRLEALFRSLCCSGAGVEDSVIHHKSRGGGDWGDEASTSDVDPSVDKAGTNDQDYVSVTEQDSAYGNVTMVGEQTCCSPQAGNPPLRRITKLSRLVSVASEDESVKRPPVSPDISTDGSNPIFDESAAAQDTSSKSLVRELANEDSPNSKFKDNH